MILCIHCPFCSFLLSMEVLIWYFHSTFSWKYSILHSTFFIPSIWEMYGGDTVCWPLMILIFILLFILSLFSLFLYLFILTYNFLFLPLFYHCWPTVMQSDWLLISMHTSSGNTWPHSFIYSIVFSCCDYDCWSHLSSIPSMMIYLSCRRYLQSVCCAKAEKLS